jgi:hypothetical protein
MACLFRQRNGHDRSREARNQANSHTGHFERSNHCSGAHFKEIVPLTIVVQRAVFHRTDLILFFDYYGAVRTMPVIEKFSSIELSETLLHILGIVIKNALVCARPILKSKAYMG